MNRILLIFCFYTLLYAYHESDHKSSDWIPYLSPGIQVGVNSDWKIFLSFQTTIGIFKGDILNDWEIFPLGLTFGKRFYYNNDKKWNSYNYLDTQLSFGLFGIGFGMIGNQANKYQKYKLWTGAWGLLSYDYINWPDRRHNFGSFAVLPIRWDNNKFKID